MKSHHVKWNFLVIFVDFIFMILVTFWQKWWLSCRTTKIMKLDHQNMVIFGDRLWFQNSSWEVSLKVYCIFYFQQTTQMSQVLCWTSQKESGEKERNRLQNFNQHLNRPWRTWYVNKLNAGCSGSIVVHTDNYPLQCSIVFYHCYSLAFVWKGCTIVLIGTSCHNAYTIFWQMSSEVLSFARYLQDKIEMNHCQSQWPMQGHQKNAKKCPTLQSNTWGCIICI